MRRFLPLPLALPALLLTLSPALSPTPAKAQAVDSYGYDAGGRYHTDNYGSSPNLNLSTHIDVSEIVAKMNRYFAPAQPSAAPQHWYEDTTYHAPSPPVKSYGQLYSEEQQRKAAAGDGEALAWVARDALYFGGDYPRAVEALQKASDAGQRPSTDLLYHLLLDKTKGVLDVDRAAKLLPILSDWGDARAKDTYGRALIAGDRVPKDPVRGLALREAACKNAPSNSNLFYELASDYETGSNGVPQDPKRAIYWYATTAWGNISGEKAHAAAAKLGVLMLAQKDALKTYRDGLARLIGEEFSPLAVADRKIISDKIALVIAPATTTVSDLGKATSSVPQDVPTIAGLMLADPRLGEPKYGEAATLLAQSQEPAACGALGILTENGWGVERDHARAMKLFEKAAAGDDGRAYYYLAEDAARQWEAAQRHPGKNVSPRSLKYDLEFNAQQGVRCGDPNAQCLWGQCLQRHGEKSIGVSTPEEKDATYREARRLWQEADKAGIRSAAFFLGDANEKGEGGAKNVVAAIALYRRASDAGYPLAQERLALLTLDGRDGIAKDPATAQALLEKAAPQLPSAANALGVLIWHSETPVVHGDQIQKWLQQSFDAGYWPAGRNLAKFWHLGIGGTKDEAQAQACLEKAGTMGGVEAAKLLAADYARGEIVEADPAAAARWNAVAAP